MKLDKDIKELTITGILVFFVLALPMKNIFASLTFTLVYFLMFYLPFLPLVTKLELSLIGKFLLINLAGLSYAFIYVILDVIFEIPLTKLTFFLVTVVLYVLNWKILKRLF